MNHTNIFVNYLPILKKDKLVTIGSHCLNHVVLAEQPTETQYQEIVESKRRLEKLVGTPVEYIAYPYGQYNQETIKIIKDNNIYRYGFTAGGYFFGKNKENRYALDRMNISNKYYADNFDLLKSIQKFRKTYLDLQ